MVGRPGLREVWKGRVPTLVKMVNYGCTEKEMGERMGVRPDTISEVLKLFGIVRVEAQGAYPPSVMKDTAVPVITTDAEGRTIKKYPSLFAEGCGITGITVKPRKS